VVGQILGGVLVSANIAGTQWRAIFLLNVPIAAITVAAGLRYLPADERRASRRIDLAGVATLTVSALLVVQGLGHSALISGLTLVPWVAAFGVAGQLVRRMPARLIALAPAVGCIILTSAYTAISITLFAGHHEEPLLIVLLAGGGLGLGLNFSAVIAHLTTAVPPGYAPDISGVASTTAAIGGTLGVAAFGTLYLGLLHAGSVHATHAFAIVTATFAAAALLATVAARRATLPSATPQAEPVSDSGIRAWP
jgi:MFS family permease